MDTTEKEVLDGVASTVAELKQNIDGMKEGLVDDDTVKRIATELIEQQAAATAIQNRRGNGFVPSDAEIDDNPRIPQGADRLKWLQSHSATKTASLIGRDEADVRAFQQAGDRLLILAKTLQRDPRELAFYRDEFAPTVQAMDSQTAAEGLEYVPTALSSDLIERVNLELRVVALFPSLVMPTQPFDIPGRAARRQRAARGVENTADTGQTLTTKFTPATRKVRLSAGKFEGEMLVSKEEEEDAIIAVLPLMEEELIDWISFDMEDAAVNGDTAGGLDSDTNGATDPRTNWNGLRKTAIAGAKSDLASAAALTVAHLRTNRAKMGVYGIKVDSIAHVLGMSSYIQLLSDSAVQTMDKYGPNATIVAGELAKVDGVSVLVSEAIRQDLNAAGVFDGVTETETVALTVFKRGFVRGIRRELEVQLLRELYAESDQDAIIVRTRQGFVSRFPNTEPTVGVGFNIDK